MSTGWIIFWLACMFLAGPITTAIFHTIAFLWRCRWHILQLTVFTAVAGYTASHHWGFIDYHSIDPSIPPWPSDLPITDLQENGMVYPFLGLLAAILVTYAINLVVQFFRWLVSPKLHVKLPPKLTYAQRLAIETAHLPPPRLRSFSPWPWRPL
jgi:hypothetical protein